MCSCCSIITHLKNNTGLFAENGSVLGNVLLQVLALLITLELLRNKFSLFPKLECCCQHSTHTKPVLPCCCDPAVSRENEVCLSC